VRAWSLRCFLDDHKYRHPPFFFPLPPASFSNFRSPVPGSSLSLIHVLLDPSHPGSLDSPWPLGLAAADNCDCPHPVIKPPLQLRCCCPRLLESLECVLVMIDIDLRHSNAVKRRIYKHYWSSNTVRSRAPSLHTTASTPPS
jgi:hypothetical protein